MQCFASKNRGHKSDGRLCYKNFDRAHQMNGLFEEKLKAESAKKKFIKNAKDKITVSNRETILKDSI